MCREAIAELYIDLLSQQDDQAVKTDLYDEKRLESCTYLTRKLILAIPASLGQDRMFQISLYGIFTMWMN